MLGSELDEHGKRYVTGQWFHQGKTMAHIQLRQDAKVRFREYSADASSVVTEPHGDWHVWDNSMAVARMMTIVFDGQGRDSIDRLTAHVMTELCPGIWRSTTFDQVLVLQSQVDVSWGAWREGRPRAGGNGVRLPNIKHFLLWLHPGRPAQFLGLTQDGHIIFCSAGSDFGTVGVGPANGEYQYSHTGPLPDDEAPEQWGDDAWLVSFQAAGREAGKNTMILRRVQGAAPVYRAAGNQRCLLDTVTEAHVLRPWHIIAVVLN